MPPKQVKTKPKQVITCSTCAWAKLVQYEQDPLLAECKCKEPQDRQLALINRLCPLYLHDSKEKLIEKRHKHWLN